MFWADYGQTPKIERAFLNGQNRTILASTGMVKPKGLTIDYATHDLYWADQATSTIEKVKKI